jgi:membrane-bound lytic murein transglycosylase D
VPDIDVQLAAKLAEMPVEEFVALNPGFSRPLIRAAVTPRIILPADKVDVFHANLSKYDEKSLVSWQAYHPRKGDTLASIAQRHGLSLAQLREVNGISPRARAVPALLVVPVKGASPGSVRRLPIMYAPPIPLSVHRVVHKVRAGETLASIARRYRVSVQDLRRWNSIGRLTVRQRLVLEVHSTARPKPKSRAKSRVKSYAKASN